MTTAADVISRGQIICLSGISWETYKKLRAETDEQHIFITYDSGRMAIDRRGSEVGALENVSWDTYLRLLDETQGQRLRMTYDNGRLTIVSPTHGHDRVKTLIGGFIETAAIQFRIPMSRLGSATWLRGDLWEGLEADECYYVQNEPRVRGKDEIDLDVDPPPDLAVEVQITHQDADRLSLYAALGVPELWHFRRERLYALKLDGGAYAPIESSLAFPMLRPRELERFLAMRHDTDETTMMVRFQEWLQTLSAHT